MHELGGKDAAGPGDRGSEADADDLLGVFENDEIEGQPSLGHDNVSLHAPSGVG